MAEKMVATVLGIRELGEVQGPDARGPEEQIELDIQVEQGELCLGKRVQLSGPSGEEVIEFRSCSLTPKRQPPWGPGSATIVCSRPKLLSIPTRDVAGWTITEL